MQGIQIYLKFKMKKTHDEGLTTQGGNQYKN
jgi:hypothetical protein